MKQSFNEAVKNVGFLKNFHGHEFLNKINKRNIFLKRLGSIIKCSSVQLVRLVLNVIIIKE